MDLGVPGAHAILEYAVCSFLAFAYPSILLPSADPLHLHSFPTRRSSDLPVVSVDDVEVVPVAELDPGGEHVGVHPLHPRSEEHTSELQSLRHLVCRLLLEK